MLERKGESGTEVTEHVWRDGEGKERRVRMVFRDAPDAKVLSRRLEGVHAADAAQRAEMLAALRTSLAEADRALADLPRIIDEAMLESNAWRDEAGRQRVVVKHGCAPGGEEVSETTGKDGTQVVRICQRRIMASARKGLEEAREEIARDKDIPEDTRKEMLRHFDRQLERWRDKEG